LLGLGANVGESQQAIAQAIEVLDAHASLRVASSSAVHTTDPIGGSAGPTAFANAVAIVESSLPPHELLRELQAVEQQFGRTRSERWAPRTLDLDLLLVGEQVIDSADLCVPHPRLSYRPFVMDPAVEIAADWPHPTLDASLGQLHHRLHQGDDAVVVYGGTAADRQWHVDRLLAGFKEIEPREATNELYLLRSADATIALPRLAIQLHTSGDRPRRGMPTLAIPATSREEVLFDTVAAVECIWPDLCRRAAAG
jgi:2-amino-4-hydroxy-6-hydroxymethyldihydropteridine diphosphokinase